MVDKTFFKRMRTTEEVEVWLADMENALGRLMQSIPESLCERLDYSLASLDALETWLLSRYSNLKEAHNPEGIILLDAAGRYVGEVVRRRADAEWYVELRKPDDAFLGIPVLRKAATNRQGNVYVDYAYPLSLVTASLDRRIGSFIRSIVEKYIGRIGTIE